MKLNQSKDTQVTRKSLTIIRGFKKLQMTITCLLKNVPVTCNFCRKLFQQGTKEIVVRVQSAYKDSLLMGIER